VTRYAGKTLQCALEIGAGTGKATRLFESRGVAVTALEPDPEMAALLERSIRGTSVDPVVTSFEQFSTARHFDLVYAAASWHWTNAGSRWSHTVDLLTPGGVLALFGRPTAIKDLDLFAAVEAVEKQVKFDDEKAGVHLWSIGDMAAVDGLVDIMQLNLPSVVTTTADDFVVLPDAGPTDARRRPPPNP